MGIYRCSSINAIFDKLLEFSEVPNGYNTSNYVKMPIKSGREIVYRESKFDFSAYLKFAQNRKYGLKSCSYLQYKLFIGQTIAKGSMYFLSFTLLESAYFSIPCLREAWIIL